MHIHVITYFSNLYSFFHYTQFQGVINIDGDTLHFDIYVIRIYSNTFI